MSEIRLLMTELWPFLVCENWFLALRFFIYGPIWMKLHGYIKNQSKGHNSDCFYARVICS